MNAPIRHTPADTWRLEFQTFRGAPHKRKLVHLRDGATVEVGARYDEDGFYVTEGKERHHSTGSLFMCAGLDGVESVRRDEKDPQVVIVADRHGAVAKGIAAAGPSLDRRRLEQSVLGGGPALVEELLAALRSGTPPSEQERSCLLACVRSFGEDVAGYERLVDEDLSRAKADLELARRAALRLLVGQEGAS